MDNLKSKKESYYFQKEDLHIPVDVFYEVRDNVRISIGRRKANLRMPIYLRPSRKRSEIEKAKVWLTHTLNNKPEIAERFRVKSYRSGDILKVGKRTYILQVDYREAKTNSGSLKNDLIKLHINPSTAPLKIKQLISRVVARDFHAQILRRVHALNDLYFKKPIKAVKLKYNQSNWGSCSSSGNINLSTRLLFAPEPVIDYVIIHELAHLIEMNHSKRFYAILSSIMPNYRNQEKWLKENGHLCDF